MKSTATVREGDYEKIIGIADKFRSTKTELITWVTSNKKKDLSGLRSYFELLANKLCVDGRIDDKYFSVIHNE